MSGGAWKVAYADFVTAMMALFMVLWISAQDEKILIATSAYFQNPFNTPMDATTGVLPFNSSKSASKSTDSSSEKGQDLQKAIEMTFLNSVAADFKRLLHLDQDMEDKPIDIQVTTDGLRITLFDRANRRVFINDTAEFTEWGTFVLQSLAWNIDRHSLRVTIDGHTRTGINLPAPTYTAWELSADRANAARRGLVHYAVSSALIDRVTGFADTRPLEGEQLESESQQRVTISLSLSGRNQDRDKGKKARTAQPSTVTSTPAPPPASLPTS